MTETWNAYRLDATPSSNATLSSSATKTQTPFRPPQWSKPQLYSITANIPNLVSASGSALTTYFFDAVLRADHRQELHPTSHPVQGGAAITDHAYMMPAHVTLEIGMSDVMDRYTAGSYTSDASKSVSAYRALLYLQSLRIPLQLTTRLNTYQNMLIESIEASDDYNTRYGLRAHVNFIQIFTASSAIQTLSGRPHQTQAGTSGSTQPRPVPEAMEQNNDMLDFVKSTLGMEDTPSVPGAGNWSSNPIALTK